MQVSSALLGALHPGGGLHSLMALLTNPRGLLLAALAVLAACLVWMGLYPLRRWRYRHLPGPFGLPFLGNLPQIIAMDVTGYLSYVANKYGPICKIWFGTRPWLVVSDPDLVRKLAFQSTARPDLSSYLDVLAGDIHELESVSTFFANGEVWRRGRKAYEAAIVHPASLAAHLPVITSCLGRFVPSLERYAASGRPVDIHKALGDLLLEITGELAYGVDFEVDFEETAVETEGKGAKQPQQQQSHLGRALAQALRDTFATYQLDRASMYLPLQLVFPALSPVIRVLARFFPDKNQRATMKCRNLIVVLSRRIMDQWVDTKREGMSGGHLAGHPEPKGSRAGEAVAAASEGEGAVNGGVVNGASRGTSAVTSLTQQQQQQQLQVGLREAGGGIRGSSFLAALLEGRKGAKQEDRLSEVEVVSQIITFMLAAFETSSNTTSLALLLLASHPEAQQRLLEEVDGVAGREISPEMLAGQLPYTEAVLKEAMRLYPPVSVMHRHAKADIDLGGGRVVPRGTYLALSNHNLHHDPALWPEPERFLPERFLPGGAASSAHPAAWAGFGMGPRMCVGHKLAMMVTQATLLSLLRRYTFELAPGQQPTPAMATGLTYAPQNGVWLRVRSRGAA